MFTRSELVWEKCIISFKKKWQKPSQASSILFSLHWWTRSCCHSFNSSYLTAGSTKRTESCRMVCYGSTQCVEPVLPLSDWTEDRNRRTITADSNALDLKALDRIGGSESCASHHQIHTLHFKVLAIRLSPGWERNSDVRHLDPKTVQHIVQDRFAHLCVCVRGTKTHQSSVKKHSSWQFCQRRVKFLYLHPRQRKCVLQPVFSILLRVGVQHDIVHLMKRKREVTMLNLFVHHALQRKNCR